MSRLFITTLSAAGLLAGAAAVAQPSMGATLGTDSAGIAAALAVDSYDVTRFERLPGALSVTAFSEDSRLELALDSGTGAVIGIAEYDRVGADERPGVRGAAVHAMLAGRGYTVISYQREGDEIDVDATRDGRRWELEIDPRSGDIREVEEED